MYKFIHKRYNRLNFLEHKHQIELYRLKIMNKNLVYLFLKIKLNIIFIMSIASKHLYSCNLLNIYSYNRLKWKYLKTFTLYGYIFMRNLRTKNIILNKLD